MKRDAYGQLHENSYPLSHTVSSRTPNTPWCLHLADDAGRYRLVCFDFDGKDKYGVNVDLMEQAHDECDALVAALTDLEIEHLVCESSGTGGRHVWIGLAIAAEARLVAELARAARANFRTLDHGMLHNPRTGAARPPLSPHRDGSSSTILRGAADALLAPSTTVAQLMALTAELEARTPALRAADTSPSGPVDAAHRTHRSLSTTGAAHMATIAGGSNPSWTGFMCLLAAASASWTLLDIAHAARTAPGMEHYRTKNTGRGRRPRSDREGRERLERQWAKAQQYAALQRPLPTSREPADLTALAAIVRDAQDVLDRFRVNPGRWGATEPAVSQRSILTCLTYLTLQTGKRVVAASIRDLALMCGLGRTTAATALQTLATDGFIERTTPTESSNAAEWQLTGAFSTASGAVRSQPLNNPRPPGELFTDRATLVSTIETQLLDQRHDLFTRGGLGHLAGKLYCILRQLPGLGVDAAARVLGISARHTATILSRLRSHKLIVRHGSGWMRSRQDLRDAAARRIGVGGTLAKRASLYAHERQVWSWWQAELNTMTTTPRSRPRRAHVTSRPLEFVAMRPGERTWPRYPREPSGRADHRQAREYVVAGLLDPDSRWQLSAA